MHMTATARAVVKVTVVEPGLMPEVAARWDTLRQIACAQAFSLVVARPIFVQYLKSLAASLLIWVCCHREAQEFQYDPLTHS